MKLDVGSGSNIAHRKPKGDINIDIHKPAHPTPNFVLADGRYLPFKSNVFDKVYSRHCLEHIPNPMLCLVEMKRVCKHGGKLTVIVPHRFVLGERNPEHINKFCQKWFKQALRLLDLESSGFFTDYGLLGLPRELRVFALKKNFMRQNPDYL